MASVADTFNRGNGDLDGSTASGGGTWVEFENAGWTVENNAAKGTKGSSYQDHSARLDVALDGDDHEAEATLTIDNSSTEFFNIGIIARKEDNATKTFYGMWARLVTGDWMLFKFVAGSFTSLGTWGTAPSVSDIMKVKCDGDQIEAFVNGTLRIGPATDSAIAGAGYIQVGLHCDTSSNPGDASLDDFSGQDLAAAGTILPQMMQHYCGSYG